MTADAVISVFLTELSKSFALIVNVRLMEIRI